MSRRHLAVAAAGVAVALSVLLGAGCGDGPSQPLDLSLAELVRQSAAYDGRLVRAEGTVRSVEHGLEPHFWIEDRKANRVAVVPGSRAAPFLGSAVVVVGTFRSDDEHGRMIVIEQLAPPSPA